MDAATVILAIITWMVPGGQNQVVSRKVMTEAECWQEVATMSKHIRENSAYQDSGVIVVGSCHFRVPPTTEN